MAKKKKRITKRSSAKAGKRQSATRRKSKRKAKPVAQNNFFPATVTSFDPTPYQIAAHQRGRAETPLPLRAQDLAAGAPIIGTPALSVMPGTSSLIADAVVIPAPVPVTPTVYPDSPGGTIIVHGNVTINFESADFKTFNVTMDALVKQMQVGRSNEISGEVCAQLLSEMTAGRELLRGPKPSRDLIELLLVRPLKWLAEKAALAIVGTLAGEALDLLLKMIM